MFLHNFLSLLLEILQLLIFVRLLLSWFPNIDWWKQPFKFIYEVTEPLLAPFRKLIPPIGGIDFSPMAIIFILAILQNLV